MRVSGSGGSETLMFIAPAAIFVGLFLWLTGDPRDVIVWLDRTVVHAGYVAWGWCTALLQAITNG